MSTVFPVAFPLSATELAEFATSPPTLPWGVLIVVWAASLLLMMWIIEYRAEQRFLKLADV